MVYDDKFFCVKMLKTTGTSSYLEILCPGWDIYKYFVFERDYF